MKIYIAASWNDRETVKIISDQLSKYDIKTTCKWWTHEDASCYSIYAIEDKKAIEECDIFILYNTSLKTQGKMIEFGMAISLEKKIVVIGELITSVFRFFIDYEENYFSIDSIVKRIYQIVLMESIKK